ncbi:Tetratricopeptide repeat protein 1 [Tolypocladium ophioglossoides CBS 100239]|uniref:Tetratricopeptide repeat protein 1 n=1 Tax=Tolypocladium ophioglossoides (strain CBS 100239) TaxID=1163406 RepID=A0A0L0NC36_TOLOC|nr:Tetratricopeptide repeat protein 1 [Tolypocladium ophioglossoides CBS 100239]
MGPSAEDSKEPQVEAKDKCPKVAPEEDAVTLHEFLSTKAQANALFSSQDYDGALARYDDAVAWLPKFSYFEQAVVQSNIAACHLKLEQWKEAIKASTQALDGLAKLEEQNPELVGTDKPAGSGHEPAEDGTSKRNDGTRDKTKAPEKDFDEEIISPGALESAPAPLPSQPPFPVEARKADVLRIRIKALLRRARARSEAGGWQNLAGAEEDYRALDGMPSLGPADMRTVRSQLKALPPRTKAAQEAEMGEMWGKLRHLGDGILKPFGLSTENFQMIKDEKSGGYSMNFTQGGGGSSS